MSYTEATSVSWIDRLRESIKGVLIGIVLILVCVIGLFWNEGRAVTTARSLDEGAGAVAAVGSDAVAPANEGRLVHLSGVVTTTEKLADPEFGILADGVRLVRKVEMYQWKETSKTETKKKLGGGEEKLTTYSYSREWSTRPIDSASFKQPDGRNNPHMEIHQKDMLIAQAELGAFSLGEDVLDRIGEREPLRVEANRLGQVRAAYSGAKTVNVVDGSIYLGDQPQSPGVGDYRISYELVPLGTISIVGQQAGDTLTRYQTAAGDRLLLVSSGNVPADQMFAQAQSVNTVVTWVIRGVGLVLVFVGFTMLLAPFAVVADVLPLFGSLVRLGSGIASFCLTLVLGSVTIAIAWFYYRPLVALIILATGAASVAAMVFLGRRTKATPEAPAPAQA